MINHVSVMLDDVLASVPQDTKIVVDGTLGHWWHTRAILDQFPSVKKVYWFDLDPNILSETKNRLSDLSDKIEFAQDSYTNISKVLWDAKADFVLLDLWVNMEHFKDWWRGFSINYDSKLDMRFDINSKTSAYEIIHDYSLEQLSNIFQEYADFTAQKSDEIARHIVKSRKEKAIETTFDLKNILNQVWLGQKASTIIFQAIRIETNKEIDNLKLALGQIPAILSTWWRFGVITFHSIEDRIVKNYFKQLSQDSNFQLLYKKAVKPYYTEVQKNRASRSAKYRVIQKI